jgi:hypothetical protein
MKSASSIFESLESKNRELWGGHSSILVDFTHVLGGLGLGMLLHPALGGRSKPLGYLLVILSTALHLHALSQKRSTVQQVRDRLEEFTR